MKPIIFLTCLALSFCTFAGDKENQAVNKRISTAIELLTKNEIKFFLKDFIHPLEGKKKKLQITESFIKKFKKRKNAFGFSRDRGHQAHLFFRRGCFLYC